MLSTQLVGIPLQSCILNASGPRCTTTEELDLLANNPFTGLVLTKSCTLESRLGNLFPRYFDNEQASINSTGLANMGLDYYLRYSDSEQPKPLFISVSGLTPNENLQIIEKIYEHKKMFGDASNLKGIELNLSCPNIIGKPQLGYDFHSVELLLNNLHQNLQKYNFRIPIGLKLPPYFDPSQFQTISQIILKYKDFIKFITCINSLGNGLIIDPITESVTIKPKEGLGGIGGNIIKPIALSNVKQFYNLLNPHGIPIIGCGGISTGMDAFEHILCGASAVQIGTQFQKERINCFQRISQELQRIMTNKGYQNINEFRGQLKTL